MTQPKTERPAQAGEPLPIHEGSGDALGKALELVMTHGSFEAALNADAFPQWDDLPVPSGANLNGDWRHVERIHPLAGASKRVRENWHVRFIVNILEAGPMAFKTILERFEEAGWHDAEGLRVAAALVRVGIEHRDGQEFWAIEPSEGEEQPVKDVATYWHKRADELADWAWKYLVNRTDCFGGYYVKDGKTETTTHKRGLTPAVLRQHFRATCTGHVIGLHSAGLVEGVSQSRWVCPEIDYHSDKDDADANQRAAVVWFGVLVDLGFNPLLVDSNGRGGYHLYVLFSEPILTLHARQLGRWLVRDWAEHGLSKAPEVFPKQVGLEPPGSEHGAFGSWLRPPGRRHKDDHWSRVWDGSNWLEGDEAIEALLNTTGDSARLIPNEALTFDLPAKAERDPLSAEEMTKGVELAAAALQFLGPGAKDKHGVEFLDDYDRWLSIGFALHDLGDDGLKLWDEWSRLNPRKYQPGACAEKWATMSDSGDSGVGIGYVYYYAEVHGWPDRPKPPEMVWPVDESDEIETDSSDPPNTVEGSASPVPAPSPGASSPAGAAVAPSGPSSPVATQQTPSAGPVRPKIVLIARRDIVEKQTVAVLHQDLELFSRGNVLGVVVEDGGTTTTLPGGVVLKGGCARFAPLSEAGLSCRLAGLIDFQQRRKDKKGKTHLGPAHPPAYLMKAVATRGHWPGVRRLQGIASAPWIRPDGSLPVPGFDQTTGTLFRPSVDLAGLLDRPTQDDAIAAADRLFKVVEQFPFASVNDRGVWLAALLTAIQRPAIAGPVPGFAFTANQPGTGKSLLVDSVGITGWGSPVPTRSYPTDGAEAGKIKLSLALAGVSVVNFDNLPSGGSYGNSELDSAIASMTVEGRILGQSRESGAVPLRPVWMLSGNNVYPGADAFRRWLPCTLATKLENPYERSDIRETNLRRFVEINRGELLCDALTILRAYNLAGKPACSASRLGGFEEWDDQIRGAVAFVTEGDISPGIDCLATQKAATKESPERLAKLALLEEWSKLPDGGDGGDGLTVAAARKLAENIPATKTWPMIPTKYPELREALLEFSNDDKLPSATVIGHKIRSMKGHRIGSLRFEKVITKRSAVFWRATTQ